MRPGSVAGPAWALLLVVAACSRGPGDAPHSPPPPVQPPPVVPAPTQRPAAAAAPAAPAGAVVIERFDCVKAEDDDPDGGAVVPGIATWSGGGPSGATWNATELRCAVALRTTCKSGTADVQVRIGNALVAHRTVPLVGGLAGPAFVITPAQWRKNLDDGKAGPVRTAVFRATALLTCRAPVEVAPGLGPRGEFAADRTFVAGFADGE